MWLAQRTPPASGWQPVNLKWVPQTKRMPVLGRRATRPACRWFRAKFHRGDKLMAPNNSHRLAAATNRNRRCEWRSRRTPATGPTGRLASLAPGMKHGPAAGPTLVGFGPCGLLGLPVNILINPDAFFLFGSEVAWRLSPVYLGVGGGWMKLVVPRAARLLPSTREKFPTLKAGADWLWRSG